MTAEGDETWFAAGAQDRRAQLRSGIDRAGRYIEIGPSFAPILPKADGWNVAVVDWTDRAGLIAHYAAEPGVDTALIEEVDHVWSGGPIADCFPASARGTFDGFIASHVIEHTTDIISFLRSASLLIKPDGFVLLAAPDKRVSFDFFRPLSTTADALLAHDEGRSRHSAKTLFENAAYCAKRDNRPGWPHLETGPFSLVAPLAAAEAAWRTAAAQGRYQDAHNWVFTPSSFRLLVLELGMLGLCDLAIEQLAPQPATEFFCRLRKGPEAAGEGRRLTLMQAVVEEVAEQALQLERAGLPRFEERFAGRTDMLHARIAALEAHVSNQDEAIRWLRRRRELDRQPLHRKLRRKLASLWSKQGQA